MGTLIHGLNAIDIYAPVLVNFKGNLDIMQLEILDLKTSSIFRHHDIVINARLSI